MAVLALAGCTDPAPEPTATAATTTPPSTPSPSPTTPAPTPTPSPTPTPRPSGPDEVQVEVEEIATGLDVPWGIAFLPSGDAVVSLREQARLVRVTPDGEVSDVGGPGAEELRDVVAPRGEAGLLGVAVLRSGENGAVLALYATAADDNRVLTGTLAGDRLGDLTPILTGIPQASNHDGGRLAVGPDGYLYVTTGDAAEPSRSQDPSSLGGKILRIRGDGSPARGNPTPGSPVWSLGHRNVQGIGWAADGRMFASEFGQNTWDELNLVQPGANYGWPAVEGEGGTGAGYVDPLVVWGTDDASPSGLAVTDEGVYLAGLRGQVLWRVPLRPADEGSGIGEPQALLAGEHGRLRAVAAAPDGSLWVLTNNTDGRGDPREGDDRILRLVVR